MKGKISRRLFTAVANLIMVAALLAGVAYAAVVNIDTFDEGTQLLLVDSAFTTASHVVNGGTDVLGSWREAYLNWVSGQDNRDVTLKIDTGGTTDDLSFAAEADAQGAAKIVWDGDQFLDSLSYTLNANLVDSDPANEGILVVVEFADQTATLQFTGYKDADNYAELAYTFNQADNRIDRLDLFFAYDDFTVTGSDVNWSSLGALQLDISGDTALDLVVDYIESTDGVCEYGDLPDGTFSGVPNYSDVLDACHIPRGLTLGDNLDTEDTYHASSDALGDDSSSAVDDEDGVTLWYDTENDEWNVHYEANGCAGTCYVRGWIDWDGDGSFQSGERVLSRSFTAGGVSGDRVLSPPDGWAGDYYYARFRICDVSAECDDPGTSDKVASNGEVEDYRWYMDPTSVELASFTAAWQGEEVLVAWETAMELDTAGFNVWRSTEPEAGYVQANDEMIPSALPEGNEGAAYSFTDASATPGIAYYYKLEELVIGRGSNWYGPVVLQPVDRGPAVTVYLPLICR